MSGDRILRIIIAGDVSGGMAALERMNVGLERSHEKAVEHGSGIAGAFTSMATAAAVVVGGLAVTAGVVAEELYKIGAPYEQLLNQIQAFTHASNAQIQELASHLYQISPQLALYGLTSEAAADAIVKLTKAGLSLADAQTAVLPVITLAKAGMIDSGEAANYAAEAMNVWGLKASDMTMVANALVGASHSSTASVTDLGDSMSYSAAAAAHAGLSFRQTTAFLAEVANAGVQGSKAGTALKDILVNLEVPTSSAGKALKTLGIDVYDSKGKMKDFGDILGLLHDKIEKLAPDKQAAAIKDIFGKIPMEAALTVVKGGLPAYQKYLALVSRSGEAADIAGAKSEGLSGAIKRTGAEFESMGQALYLKVAPTFTKLVNGFADGLPKLINLAQRAGTVIGRAFNSPQGKAIGGELKSEFESVIPIVTKLSGFVQQVFHSAKAQGVFTALIRDGREAATVIRQDIIPFVRQLVEFTVNKLAPAFVDVYEHKLLPGIKAVADFVSGTLLPKFHSIMQALQPVVVFVENWIVAKLVPLFKWAIEQLKPVFKNLGDAISSLLDFAQVAIKILRPILEFLINMLSGPVIDAVKGFFNGVIRIVSGLLKILRGILDFLTGIFTGNWSKAWKGIKEIFSGVINVILGLVKAVFFGKMLKFVADGIGAIKDLFTKGWKFFEDIFTKGFQFLLNIFKDSGEEQLNIIKSGWSKVTEFFKTVVKWITDFFKGGWQRILNDIKEALTWYKAAIQYGWHAINDFIDSALTKMANIVYSGGVKVLQWFKDLPGNILKAVADFGNLLIQAGKDLVEGLIKGIKNVGGMAVDAVKGLGHSVVSGFKSLLGINSPSRVFDELGQGTGQGYVNGITKSLPGVRAAMSRLGAILPNLSSHATYSVGLTNAATRLATSTGLGTGTAAAGGYGQAPLIVQLGGVTVKGSVTTDKELATALAVPVRDAIRQVARKNGGRTGLPT